MGKTSTLPYTDLESFFRESLDIIAKVLLQIISYMLFQHLVLSPVVLCSGTIERKGKKNTTKPLLLLPLLLSKKSTSHHHHHHEDDDPGRGKQNKQIPISSNKNSHHNEPLQRILTTKTLQTLVLQTPQKFPPPPKTNPATEWDSNLSRLQNSPLPRNKKSSCPFLVETAARHSGHTRKTLLRLSSRAATVTARLRHSDRTVAAW